MGQTDYHQGATVPPGKHHPFCDRCNLQLLVTQAGAGSQARRLFRVSILRNNWWRFQLCSWQRKKKEKTIWTRPFELLRGCETASRWILFNVTLVARSQRECFQSIELISEVGFSFLQKECAKLGAAIITAHLWASWNEIVHFPSESVCRPIIRIILGTPGYPVVTASSESISRSHRSCPELKQLRHSPT